ncbi:MAG TPA: M24 family metallopeptidase [Nocardioides sp.]|nr:M24 family metallopeptidase [Nocardioides sp.]
MTETTAAIAVTDGHPHFSAEEMQRRHEVLLDAAGEAGVSRVLSVGSNRNGTAVQWLTGWPVTRDGFVLTEAGRPDTLLVGFYNHVPQARELARDAEVGYVGPVPVETVLATLAKRGPQRKPLGLVGPVSAHLHRSLTGAGIEVVDLNPAYTRLRQIKSAEEVAWLRRGAELSDAGIAALTASLRSGLTEHELCDLVERAYVPRGGTTHIHYFGVTPMAAPARANPAQYPSARPVEPGDAVVLELSAAFGGYAGQVLRSFSVEADPTPLYQELHDVAERAFDAIAAVLQDGTTAAEIQDAASLIEDAGFTTLDDLVHGFGGGYLPPVLGSRSRHLDPRPAPPIRTGMTVVVQPNVVTTDGRAGVQFGELLHVTEQGAERLHAAPRGMVRVG